MLSQKLVPSGKVFKGLKHLPRAANSQRYQFGLTAHLRPSSSAPEFRCSDPWVGLDTRLYLASDNGPSGGIAELDLTDLQDK
jgi:hypothetical protein